jgi:hypothetical protein
MIEELREDPTQERLLKALEKAAKIAHYRREAERQQREQARCS